MAQDQIGSAESSPPPPPRTVAEIQADIEETRQRLVGSIGQLKEETKPAAMAGRAKAKVRAVFVDDEGNVRRERVAAVAGVVVGLVILRRSSRARARRRHLEELSQVVWVPIPRTSMNPELAPFARNAAELAPPVEGYLPAIGSGN